ncbi:hypothetical protein LMH73_009300 [Vibrio splendidus]|nr:hypothetical protein [Vibrio splendidus]MCC4881853.1 hypothetical protein [Vibrio splendidus]
MEKLTAAEKKWFKKVQSVLNECPSKRIAFFTIGDNNIQAFNAERHDEISDFQDSGDHDFITSVSKCEAGFNASLVFTNPVESTAG